MSHVKDNILNNYFSQLRDFIDDEPLGNNTEIALLALHQLQKITAGAEPPVKTIDGTGMDETLYTCSSRPRADGTAIGEVV